MGGRFPGFLVSRCAGQTTVRQRMKEPYGKDLASRPALSRAEGTRKGPAEASVGVHVSRVLSCEIGMSL